MVLILVMTALCVIGTELSAKVQNVLILAQVAFLLVFVVVALYRVYAGTSTFDSVEPAFRWLNPFGAGGAALTGGLLLGVFIYWGWESAVNLTEEVENSATAPGKAGIWSTVVLLVTYLSVGFAVVAYAGTAFLAENADEEEFIFALLASEVMGGWDWVVLLAVSTSALASTQTTIIPASRTALSMARRHALPAHLRTHPPAVPHTRREHVVGRRHRHRLVPRRQPDQHQRPLRLAHRAVLADRVLLRAHRRRLRGLLPPPSHRERPATSCSSAWARWSAPDC